MSPRRATLWLLAISVGARLAVLAVLGFAPEPYEYEDLADSLLAGHGYQRELYGAIHRAQGPPLYAFLCAGVYAVTGHSRLAVVLVQIATSSLLSVIVLRLGRRLGRSTGSSFAAALVPALHPGLIIYAVRKLHPLNLDALLIATSLLALLRARDAGRLRPFAAAGVLLGVTILSRPTIGLFVLAAAGWLACTAASGKRLSGPILLVCSAALIVAPWTIRNALVFHQLVPITTDTGELFWRGNHTGASGSGYLPNGRPVFADAPPALQQAIASRNELERQAFFFHEGVVFARTQSAAFLRLLGMKWLSFWWFPSTAGRQYPPTWLRLYQLAYAPLLLLTLMGAPRRWRRLDHAGRQALILISLLMLCLSVAQSLFYVDVRHRWTIEPLFGLLV